MNDLKYVLINVICFLMLSCGAVIKGSGCGADRVPSKTAYRMVFSSGPRHFDSADQAKKILDDQRVQEGQKKAAENLQRNNSMRLLPVPNGVHSPVFYAGVKCLCGKNGEGFTFAGLHAVRVLGGSDAYDNVGQNIHDVTIEVKKQQDCSPAVFVPSAPSPGSK